MNPVNPFSISGLLIVIFNLPLLLLLLKSGKTPITRIYALHILAVIFWGAGSIFIGFSTDLKLTPIIWGIGYTGVVFISVFLYHSIYILTKGKQPWKLIFCYSQAIIILIVIFIAAIKNPDEIFFRFYSMYYHKGNCPVFS